MDTGVHGLNYDGDVRRETAKTGVRVRSVPLALWLRGSVAGQIRFMHQRRENQERRSSSPPTASHVCPMASCSPTVKEPLLPTSASTRLPRTTSNQATRTTRKARPTAMF